MGHKTQTNTEMHFDMKQLEGICAGLMKVNRSLLSQISELKAENEKLMAQIEARSSLDKQKKKK